MAITMRDLFSGTPVVNPTLQELADERPEHTLYEQSRERVGSVLPGEDAESHPDYPGELVASIRRQLASVRERVEHRVAHPAAEPVPAPEFDEAAFHAAHKRVSDRPENNLPPRADVWPWPNR